MRACRLRKATDVGFFFDGEDYYVEYEGLHWLCTNYGVYGHKAETCKTGQGTTKTGAQVDDNSEKENTGDMDMEEARKSDQNLRRVVQKPSQQKCGGKEKQAGSSRQQTRGYRFGVLTDEEEGEIGVEHVGKVELPVGTDRTSITGVVEELRSSNPVLNSREKKEGIHKRQTKSKNLFRENNMEISGQ